MIFASFRWSQHDTHRLCFLMLDALNRSRRVIFLIGFVRSLKKIEMFPIPSMGLVYLPTFIIKINHSCIGKYTIPMDGMGSETFRKL